MESQLIEATWGLVAATSLLFLTSAVPAIGEFVNWSNKKKALASDVLPTLHRMRQRMIDMRTELLSLSSPVSPDEVFPLKNDSDYFKKDLKVIENIDGLSLDQRMEIYVLSIQIPVLHFHLVWLSSLDDPDEEEHSIMSDEERLREAIINCQAMLLSLDRLDRLFVGVRKKYRGRTFTEEVFARGSADRDEAEKQLVDIRRDLRTKT